MRITKELIEIFVNWTKLKIRLHASEFNEKEIYFKKRQIWWVSLGQNIGSEQNGKNKNFERPILILKKFNADTFLSLSVSTKIKTGFYYYKFTNNENEYCLNLSQIRILSSKRLLRLVGEINDSDFKLVKERIKKFL